MAARVQLSSEVHLGYFEPTVDQYLKKIEQALASNDLTGAQQALAQLKTAMARAAQSSEKGTGTSWSVAANLGSVGAALGSGDPALAGQALNELRRDLSSAHRGQSGGESADQASAPGEAQTDTPSGGGQVDAVRTVDLKA